MGILLGKALKSIIKLGLSLFVFAMKKMGSLWKQVIVSEGVVSLAFYCTFAFIGSAVIVYFLVPAEMIISIFFLVFCALILILYAVYFVANCISRILIAFNRQPQPKESPIPYPPLFEKTEKLTDVQMGIMSGLQYEQFVANRLKHEGYHNVTVTKASGDFGVDVIAYDSANRKVCVQCKLYNSPVGIRAVQEIIAAKEFCKGDVAIVVTNNTFTNAAIQMAQETGVVLKSNYK